MTNKEIPEFIKTGGCINCPTSRRLKERTGNDYGFDHELMVRCVLLGCDSYGFNIMQPYIDPRELVRLANKIWSPEVAARATIFCRNLQERFGEYYAAQGLSVDEILVELKSSAS